MVIVPVRDVWFGFELTKYVTDPLPLPEVPKVIFTQLRLSVEVQAQPVCVDTLRE